MISSGDFKGPGAFKVACKIILQLNVISLYSDILHKVYCPNTVKPVLSGHSKRRPKIGFKANCRLMQAKRAFCNTFDLN